MLEPLVKNYAAEVLKVAPEYLDEIADSSTDGRQWAVSFDDYLVRISEFERENTTYVSCLACLDKPELADKMQRLEDYALSLQAVARQYAEPMLCLDRDQEIISLFACSKAEDMDDKSFKLFMQSFTNTLLYLVNPKDTTRLAGVKLDPEGVQEKLKYLQNFLTDGGCDYQKLKQNLMRIVDGKNLALVRLNPAARLIVLRSLICRRPSPEAAAELLACNPRFMGDHFADLSKNGIFFNSVLDCSVLRAQSLSSSLALHFALCTELASQLEAAKTAGSADGQGDLLQFTMNNFLAV